MREKKERKTKKHVGLFFCAQKKRQALFFPEMWTVEKQQKQHTTHNKKRKCEEQI